MLKWVLGKANSKQNKAFCVSKKGTDWALGFCFGVASQLIARGANAIA
ncbi:hypothetical protein K7474_001624 [Campylobacter upsaliensis]|nr:hypothetical protein [Campylobacter upsaliensis]